MVCHDPRIAMKDIALTINEMAILSPNTHLASGVNMTI
jgi:hypothetical protein